MLCTPPVPVTTVVAGPQGMTGPIGPTGPIGLRGSTGPAGVPGPTGVQGNIGLKGDQGATGVTGSPGSSNPLALFTGAFWSPSYPYSDQLNALVGDKIIDFGTIPFETGEYLFHLEMQVGWNGNPAGQNVKNGYCFIGNTLYDPDGPGTIRKFYWAAEKLGSFGYTYGDVHSYSHWFTGNINQGSNLYLQCNAEFYLLGAQLCVFNLPSYTITSPGFIN